MVMLLLMMMCGRGVANALEVVVVAVWLSSCCLLVRHPPVGWLLRRWLWRLHRRAVVEGPSVRWVSSCERGWDGMPRSSKSCVPSPSNLSTGSPGDTMYESCNACLRPLCSMAGYNVITGTMDPDRMATCTVVYLQELPCLACPAGLTWLEMGLLHCAATALLPPTVHSRRHWQQEDRVSPGANRAGDAQRQPVRLLLRRLDHAGVHAAGEYRRTHWRSSRQLV